ncbi:MAG: hypothetical protein M1837_006479 [Sclerophora amabilis]|nr:MAG: hypothetical protein M1837_006479 [Sclerophora amabilis]
MSGFPSLQPAMTAQVVIAPPFAIGNLSRGSGLNVVSYPNHIQPITAGTLKSEPGFSPAVDAEFVHGSDYIHADPTQKHVRLNVKSVLKNKDGAVGYPATRIQGYTWLTDNWQQLIALLYTGTINLSEATAAILQGSPDAKTTEFGDAFTHLEIETGADSLRELESGQFVASGRFVIEPGKPTMVEYKISKVVVGK